MKGKGIGGRAVVVCVLAVAAVVFYAVSAAAEYEWQIQEVQLGSGGSETISGSGGTFTIASKIGETSVSISCEKAELTSSTINAEGTGASSLKLSSGCKLTGIPFCKVTEPISLKAKTEMVGVGTKIYNQYAPAEGSKFASVKIEGCAAAGEYALEGKFAAEMEPGERVNQPLAFSAKISEEAKTTLTFGGKAATIQGTLQVALSGAHAGEQVGESPVASDKLKLPFQQIVVKQSEKLDVTTTNKTNKEVVFKQAQIIGGAGIFQIDADTCSTNTYKQGISCKITVKFEPQAVQQYQAQLLIPWETKDGVLFGGSMVGLTGKGK